MSYFPGSFAVPEEFLKDLDAQFPHRCPDPNDSEAEMWMKAGERRLVDFLWAKFKDFQEDPLIYVQ